MTGGRIKKVEKYLDGEPFLATYGDGIADIDLSKLLNFHATTEKTATMTTTQPASRFGVVDIDSSGTVTQFREKPKVNDWINIGYFVFQPQIFNYLDENSILEEEPLRALADLGQLGSYKHTGFWQPMDTYRESQLLNNIWDSGNAPWKIWD